MPLPVFFLNLTIIVVYLCVLVCKARELFFFFFSLIQKYCHKGGENDGVKWWVSYCIFHVIW